MFFDLFEIGLHPEAGSAGQKQLLICGVSCTKCFRLSEGLVFLFLVCLPMMLEFESLSKVGDRVRDDFYCVITSAKRFMIYQSWYFVPTVALS